jgi:hypothetical protein
MKNNLELMEKKSNSINSFNLKKYFTIYRNTNLDLFSNEWKYYNRNRSDFLAHKLEDNP